MRHRIAGTKFSLSTDHRKSLLKNLLTSLILHDQMITTEAKAKALKSCFDKLVTRAKKNDLVARRMVAKRLYDKIAYYKLFDELVPQLQKRQSGFTTTERLDERLGDQARMVKISILKD